MARRALSTILGIFFLLFFFASTIARFVTDFWWFKALGFAQIFLISFKAKILLFGVATIIFFLFAYGNLLLAKRFRKSPFFMMKVGLLALLSLLVGWTTSTGWFTILQYLHQVTFDLADPIFAKDVGFYVFTLPFLDMVWGFAFSMLLLTFIIILFEYAQAFIVSLFSQQQVGVTLDGLQNIKGFWKGFKRVQLGHLTVLAAGILLLLAWKHFLLRFSIMFSETGVVFGAGYTDVNVFLPILSILMIFAIVLAVLAFVWLFFLKRPRFRKHHLLAGAFGLYVLIAFFGTPLIGGVVQALIVSPNELNL